MNCISGSNTVYTTEFLSLVLPSAPPYIVDDTYWVLECHRRGLGRITYAPRAKATLQDPTTLGDWYKQNLRWLWGTFQGIHGHRVGRSVTRFDLAYVLLIVQWVTYVALTPVVIYAAVSGRIPAGAWLATGALYGVWATAAAIATKRAQLIVLFPAILALDYVYRVVFVHALLKTIRRPAVESCKWTSPPRLTQGDD
jgi:biofilm PGA synthesis N-glycosyltransferase PgaC